MDEVIITGDMSSNDIIRKYPSTIGVFNSYNIDSCCGGAEPISEAAREAGIDLEEFITALKQAASV